MLKQKRLLIIGALCMVLCFLVAGIAVFGKTDEDGKLNIVLLGVDKMVPLAERDPETNSIGQTDAIYIVSIDLETKAVNVVSVPRDSMVYVDMYTSKERYLGKKVAQICTQYAYGDGLTRSCELTMNRVQEIFPNVTFDAYVAINVNAIMDINDAIGGVEVVVPDIYTAAHLHCDVGETVNVMGMDAMNFIRVRECDVEGSAANRAERLKHYIDAFIPKAIQSVKQNPGLVIKLYKALEPNMVMNVEPYQIAELFKVVKNLSTENVQMFTLEGQTIVGATGYEECYLYPEHMAEIGLLLQ